MNNDALIGYTGFVGGALMASRSFGHHYNSKNIDSIAGQEHDLLICSGAPAEKWRANEEPDRDRENLQHLMSCLEKSAAKCVVLISTIDVYPNPDQVDEDSVVAGQANHAYGTHRYELERFVVGHFSQVHVLRLPALFGPGLKKNLVFDLIHNNRNDWTHCESRFQFYDTTRLWNDCERVIDADLELVNLATEPVSAKEIARDCFGIEFDNVTQADPANYDMRTRHGAIFGNVGSPYIATKAETITGITDFARQSRIAA